MRDRRPFVTPRLGIILGAGWLLTRLIRSHKKVSNSRGSYGASYYHVRYRRSGMLSLILLAADLYAIPAVLRSKMAIDAAGLAGIDPALVPLHDRRTLRHDPQHRERFRRLSDDVLRAIILLPLMLLADRRIRRDAASLGMLYVWLHAATYTIYSYSPLGPAFIDKYRPVVYYTAVPEEERARGNNRNSRYSGHTGNAACASFFMAKVYTDYHPEPGAAARWILYMLACVPPLFLGWLRTRALKHFPSDVLLAIVIGGCCGIVIPELHKRAVAATSLAANGQGFICP